MPARLALNSQKTSIRIEQKLPCGFLCSLIPHHVPNQGYAERDVLRLFGEGLRLLYLAF
jgi:hypothetical protein